MKLLLAAFLLLGSSAFGATVTREFSSGRVYIDVGDFHPMQAYPLTGIYNGSTYLPVKVDVLGQLMVSGGGGGSSSFSLIDQASYAYGLDSFVPGGGVFQNTSPTLTAGQAGALRLTSTRGQHVNLRSEAGTELGTAGAPIRVDPTGLTTQPVSIATSVAVTGPLTDAQLRATPVPVSGSVTANLGTIAGVSTSANQTNGTQQTKLTDGTLVSNIRALSTQVVSTDNGLVTNSVIHGLTTGGGGGYVDVKVNPSGALTAEVTQASGANLHAVLDTTSTTAVTQATASNLNAQVVGNVASAATDSGNPVKIGGIFNSTTPTFTNGQRADAQMSAFGALLTGVGRVPSYTASTAGAGFTAATTATDICTLTGSATKTIRVWKVGYSSSKTNAGPENIVLLKRSTADTAGTSTALTSVAYDSNNAAATATALNYTANPTVGTLVGNVRSSRISVGQMTGTSAVQGMSMEWVFGLLDGTQAVTLRGTAQVLAVNQNATTFTGNTTHCYFEWSEE